MSFLYLETFIVILGSLFRSTKRRHRTGETKRMISRFSIGQQSMKTTANDFSLTNVCARTSETKEYHRSLKKNYERKLNGRDMSTSFSPSLSIEMIRLHVAFSFGICQRDRGSEEKHLGEGEGEGEGRCPEAKTAYGSQSRGGGGARGYAMIATTRVINIEDHGSNL